MLLKGLSNMFSVMLLKALLYSKFYGFTVEFKFDYKSVEFTVYFN